jgi:uncharacterized protein (TIGR00255 family)
MINYLNKSLKGNVMIISMTGYSNVTENFDDFDIVVSLKSVNSKYIDIKVRLPKFLYEKEIEIVNILKDKLSRGKVDAFIDITLKKPTKKAKINIEYFNMYMDVLKDIQIKSGILDEIRIDHILRFDDVIQYTDNKNIEESVDEKILAVILKAVELLKQMRSEEGENLKKVITDALVKIEKLNEEIKKYKELVYEYNFEKYKKRLKELLNEVNEERVVVEAGIISERLDISEEVDRIDSHIKQFYRVMENEFPCGKKLDFLCQELNREFNTIGSKSQQIEVINCVIAAKTEVDKIREQVQNII